MERFRVVALFLMVAMICGAAVFALAIDPPVFRAVVVFLAAIGAGICGCVLACESPNERAVRMSRYLEHVAREDELALDRADAKREAREDPPAGEVEPDSSDYQRADERAKEEEARRRAAAAPWREVLRRAGITEPERAIAEFLPAPPRTPSFLPHPGYEADCACPDCARDNAVKAERRAGWELDAEIESQSDGIARSVGLSPSHRVALRIVARHVLLNEEAKAVIDLPTNALMVIARESLETGLDPVSIAIAVGHIGKLGAQTFAQYVGDLLDVWGMAALERSREGMMIAGIGTPSPTPTSS